MKKYYSYLFLFLIFNFNTAFAQYVWTQISSFPGTARYAGIGFAIGNKGYVGTGYDGISLRNDFWEYDPGTNTWTQKADFGGAARFSAVEFVIDTVGYVGLGSAGYPNYDFVTDLWMYNPTSNTWTQKNNFPGPGRYDAARFVANGKAYIGTGWAPFFNDLWGYDPVADAWTQEADFPGGYRSSTAYFSYGGKGYVGLGATNSTYYNDLYEYDPAANSWTQKANFPDTARNNTANFTIGNYMYMGLGSYTYPNVTFLNDFWRYDPSADSWTEITRFPGAVRYHAASFVINCSAYVGLGAGDNYYNDFYQLNACALSVPPKASFQSSDSTICANDCISFTNTSTNATSWLWSFPGAIPSSSTDENPQTVCYLVAGNYNVTLIAYNGSTADTLSLTNYIHVNPIPSVPDITNSHDTLYCSTDTSYISYQWYYYNSLIPAATDTFLVYAFTGNYNVSVTNIYGCSIAVGINLITGLSEAELNPAFTLYPNPVNNKLTISMLKDFHNADIYITDMLGRGLLQKTFESGNNNEEATDFSRFAPGAYFVTVNADGEKLTRKVIKVSASE